MTDAPERHIVIEIKLGADSIRDAINALDQIGFQLTEIEAGGDKQPEHYHSVSGGPDSGWVITVRVNRDVTHESYFEALQTFIDEGDRREKDTVSG